MRKVPKIVWSLLACVVCIVAKDSQILAFVDDSLT